MWERRHESWTVSPGPAPAVRALVGAGALQQDAQSVQTVPRCIGRRAGAGLAIGG